MNARRVTGIDGKNYPGQYAPIEVREYVIGRAHWLSHEDGLSVRKIVAGLAAEGHSRSVGSVAAYLKQPCDHCSGDVNATPEHPTVQVGQVSHLNGPEVDDRG